ncbi:MAG: hypothetical protein N2379_07330, partial [Verrucomicrobiae bacterium]|nr:hypothetical protein [Verrucomicrobiae bacterium]
LWDFIRKRRRATVHFLRVQEEMPLNWMKEKPAVPLWLAALYCVSVIGPLWHALRGWLQRKDPRWWCHVLACPATVLGNAWGIWTYCSYRARKKLVAELQSKSP